ncbi:MAG: FAD-binding protein [Acidobacteriota bacterium]
MNLKKLQAAIQGKVFSDEETLQEVAYDFGHMTVKMPKAVVVPASSQDVQSVIRLACQEGWSVTPRGAGHSQGGQSLSDGGILLDLSELNELGQFEADSLWAEAGCQWNDVVQKTLERGLVPPVLTSNLNVTIGGTLSSGGFGATSHHHGDQSDHIEELEVVTGEGHLVRCSPAENPELFSSSLAGLGQFSIITRARLKLRTSSERVRTYFLLYDRLDHLMADQEVLIKGDRFQFLQAWCSPCLQGFQHEGEIRIPITEWFFPLHLSVEYGGTAPWDEAKLEGLRFYRRIHVEDSSFAEFLQRPEPVFSQWRQSGAWNLAHPWMEILLPWKKAAAYIAGVLKSIPPAVLPGGQVILWPYRRRRAQASLLQEPPGDLIMGFGVQPSVSRQSLPMTLALLNKASQIGMDLGGKRILTGWIGFDQAQWQSHFGASWFRIRECKRFYDPHNILNPGFIPFEL